MTLNLSKDLQVPIESIPECRHPPLMVRGSADERVLVVVPAYEDLDLPWFTRAGTLSDVSRWHRGENSDRTVQGYGMCDVDDLRGPREVRIVDTVSDGPRAIRSMHDFSCRQFASQDGPLDERSEARGKPPALVGKRHPLEDLLIGHGSMLASREATGSAALRASGPADDECLTRS